MSIEGPTGADGPGPHPLVGRQDRLVTALRIVGYLAWASAAVGALLPGAVGRFGAVALVVVLVAAPLGRVAWLGVRWVVRGDPRFALAAAALLVIALSGAVLT
jgi:hypothetical protein